MKKLPTNEIKFKANDIRQDIINMLVTAGSGHSAGPLDMADVFAELYFGVMEHNPEDPKWEGRDRLVLSCGHICPVLYATMAEAGYFPKEELLTLRKLGTRLQGHPHNSSLPGIETTSGPLSQGSSQAVGMALGLKMDHKHNHIYLIMSDGEQQEGQIWEAVMFAGKNKLNNLKYYLNNFQIFYLSDLDGGYRYNDMYSKHKLIFNPKYAKNVNDYLNTHQNCFTLLSTHVPSHFIACLVHKTVNEINIYIIDSNSTGSKDIDRLIQMLVQHFSEKQKNVQIFGHYMGDYNLNFEKKNHPVLK